jgi:hypothetical protein
MNAADGLLHLCRNAMISESIWFTADANGEHRLALEALPYRTIIDIHNLARLTGTSVKLGNAMITIEAAGRTVIYDRIGLTLEGQWVCNMRLGAGPDVQQD